MHAASALCQLASGAFPPRPHERAAATPCIKHPTLQELVRSQIPWNFGVSFNLDAAAVSSRLRLVLRRVSVTANNTTFRHDMGASLPGLTLAANRITARHVWMRHWQLPTTGRQILIPRRRSCRTNRYSNPDISRLPQASYKTIARSYAFSHATSMVQRP